MHPEIGPFEAFYSSPVQHPLLLWLAGAVGIALALSRRELSPSMRRYCAALGVLTLMDAWLTAKHIIGIGSLSGPLGSAVPLFFVLAGDFRYLLLVTAADTQGEIALGSRALRGAAGLTVIVPIFSQVALSLLPESLNSSRVLFLVYEVSFVLLTLTLIRVHPRARSIPWIRSVSQFVVFYYALWASADLVILLTDSDLGFALRVVPNVLYYGGLIAVMGRFAPTQALPPSGLPPTR